jgi:hypothetical protein
MIGREFVLSPQSRIYADAGIGYIYGEAERTQTWDNSQFPDDPGYWQGFVESTNLLYFLEGGVLLRGEKALQIDVSTRFLVDRNPGSPGGPSVFERSQYLVNLQAGIRYWF